MRLFHQKIEKLNKFYKIVMVYHLFFSTPISRKFEK
jgi:hypothetical protein